MLREPAAWSRSCTTWGLVLFTAVFSNMIRVSKMTTLNAVMSVATGERLKECSFHQQHVNSMLDCAHLCLSHYTKCKSINFGGGKGPGKKVCQLNNMTRTTIPSKLLQDETFDYLEPIQVHKDTSQTAINPEINEVLPQPIHFVPFFANFTNLGSRGINGPTSLGSFYAGQDHETMVILNAGIQHWTVPYCGTYQITAVGASGGYDTQGPGARGRGARMKGDFDLEAGDVIKVLVGQAGEANTGASSSGGGGGAFVATTANVPLIVAGGGGGMELVADRITNCDASKSTSGKNNKCSGYCSSWPGGVNGNGATAGEGDTLGGGGGGFYTNGRSGVNFGGPYGTGGEGGRGFMQGGRGGKPFQNTAAGGFGGGGGGYGNGGGPGGGGGYSGGASGDAMESSCGGGGGSYNAGRNQLNRERSNGNGHGYVEILRLN